MPFGLSRTDPKPFQHLWLSPAQTYCDGVLHNHRPVQATSGKHICISRSILNILFYNSVSAAMNQHFAMAKGLQEATESTHKPLNNPNKFRQINCKPEMFESKRDCFAMQNVACSNWSHTTPSKRQWEPDLRVKHSENVFLPFAPTCVDSVVDELKKGHMRLGKMPRNPQCPLIPLWHRWVGRWG